MARPGPESFAQPVHAEELVGRVEVTIASHHFPPSMESTWPVIQLA